MKYKVGELVKIKEIFYDTSGIIIDADGASFENQYLIDTNNNNKKLKLWYWEHEIERLLDPNDLLKEML